MKLTITLIFTILILTACNANNTDESEISSDTAISLDQTEDIQLSIETDTDEDGEINDRPLSLLWDRTEDIQLSVEIDGDTIIEMIQNLSNVELMFGEPIFEYFDGEEWQMMYWIHTRFAAEWVTFIQPHEYVEVTHSLSDYTSSKEHTLLRIVRRISTLGYERDSIAYLEFELSN